MADVQLTTEDLNQDLSAFEDAQTPEGQSGEGASSETDTSGSHDRAVADAAGRQAQDQPPAVTDQIPAELQGTPFKNVRDLVGSYKTLQRTIGSKDKQFQDLRTQVQTLVRGLTAQQQGTPTAEVTKDQADVFLKEFLTNPNATIAAAVDRQVAAAIRQHVDPIRGQITSDQQGRMIDAFVTTGKGSTLSTEQQDRFLEILDENKWISKVPDPLGTAYNMLVAEDPATFAAQSRQTKDAVQRDLNEAKKGAGLGGKRGSPQAQGSGKRDAFDDVLDRAKDLSWRP